VLQCGIQRRNAQHFGLARLRVRSHDLLHLLSDVVSKPVASLPVPSSTFYFPLLNQPSSHFYYRIPPRHNRCTIPTNFFLLVYSFAQHIRLRLHKRVWYLPSYLIFQASIDEPALAGTACIQKSEKSRNIKEHSLLTAHSPVCVCNFDTTSKQLTGL
jgi:hypothetical protein